jgi:hypothetical protein
LAQKAPNNRRTDHGIHAGTTRATASGDARSQGDQEADEGRSPEQGRQDQADDEQRREAGTMTLLYRLQSSDGWQWGNVKAAMPFHEAKRSLAFHRENWPSTSYRLVLIEGISSQGEIYKVVPEKVLKEDS